MSYLANSPLKYLKDNDVILMLLEYVEKTPKYTKIFHINLLKKRILYFNSLNCIKKEIIDKTFGWIYQSNLDNKVPYFAALIPLSYPFYRNPKTNTLVVKETVRIIEKARFDSREYRKYHPGIRGFYELDTIK